ncbi:hypothetical protein HC256_007951 [Beauveria bassiana]|nr:hypothetical protein HC256_007951 [Beauveria bassiana]
MIVLATTVKYVNTYSHLSNSMKMKSYNALANITDDSSQQPKPVSAIVLACKEASLRDRLARFQPVRYGCTELDGALLRGGLQRGSIVGISADFDGFGLLMGLQSMIRAILDGSVNRALVITPKPLASVTKLIVGILKSELSNYELDPAKLQEKCHTSLEGVMLSVVFDIDGIWQTLAELLQPGNRGTPASVELEEGITNGLNTERDSPNMEIHDSKDEGMSPSTEHGCIVSENGTGPPSFEAHGKRSSAMSPPEIIVVTHFSTLLTSLFARRENAAAHQSLALLKTRLRWLSRSSSMPLLLLVNSTMEEPSTKHKASAPELNGLAASNRSSDATLRSIFAYVRTLRPSKPSFGIVFSQFLDLHLLCTDISGQERASYSLGEHSALTQTSHRRLGPTLVEVLQDNLELNSPHARECHREQRWAILDVSNQQIVNAYEHHESQAKGKQIRK